MTFSSLGESVCVSRTEHGFKVIWLELHLKSLLRVSLCNTNNFSISFFLSAGVRKKVWAWSFIFFTGHILFPLSLNGRSRNFTRQALLTWAWDPERFRALCTHSRAVHGETSSPSNQSCQILWETSVARGVSKYLTREERLSPLHYPHPHFIALLTGHGRSAERLISQASHMWTLGLMCILLCLTG